MTSAPEIEISFPIPSLVVLPGFLLICCYPRPLRFERLIELVIFTSITIQVFAVSL